VSIGFQRIRCWCGLRRNRDDRGSKYGLRMDLSQNKSRIDLNSEGAQSKNFIIFGRAVYPAVHKKGELVADCDYWKDADKNGITPSCFPLWCSPLTPSQ